MIHARLNMFSEELGMGTSVTVLHPQRARGQIGMGAKAAAMPRVLYLLHGLSDDDTGWTRRTAIERHAAERDLLIVMPAVARSFYCDEVHGEKYFSFLATELPAIIGNLFGVSTRRADTFVAGLSMGGFGAMKLALHYPERFAAAGSFSGVLDPVSWLDGGRHAALCERVWGRGEGPEPGSADDLIGLLGASDAAALPRLFVTCGTDDDLLTANERFIAAATAVDADLTTDVRPGGHSWDFWDRDVENFLRFID